MKGQQTQHTPGPWKVDSVWALIMGPNGEEIAACHSGEAMHTKRAAASVAQANARLIAAAPELLEALRGLVDLCACDSGFNQRSAMQNARVAIAKATQS